MQIAEVSLEELMKCLNFSFYQDIRAHYLKVMNLEDQCEESEIIYGESDTEDSEPEDEEAEDVKKTDPFTGKKIDPAKDSSDSDSESDSWMRPWHEIYS